MKFSEQYTIENHIIKFLGKELVHEYIISSILINVIKNNFINKK